MRVLFYTIFFALFLMQTGAQSYYVAPYGATTNSGDPDSPKSLAWATAQAPVGSTIYLIPGTYTGTFTSSAAGVTYRSLPGTRAKIDGALFVTGADVVWKDIELFSSWPTPRTADNGSQLYVTGARAKVTGSYIHDTALGVGLWKPATGAVLENNLIWNNGYLPSTGPNLYTQNSADSGVKRIAQNIIGPSFNGYGLHVYSSAGADAVHGFLIDRNISFNSEWLIGGPGAASGITVTNNLISGGGLQLGYTGVNTDVVATGNTVINSTYALTFNRWKSATVRGNTFVTTAGNFIVDRIDVSPHTYDWDANQWWYGGVYSQPFGHPSFASWQATGVDATSTYTHGLPLQNIVTVWPAGANRGIVAIQNWEGVATVVLDLSPLALAPGASYRLVNAQNPAEGLTFVAGAPVSLSTGGWTAATPIGMAAPLRPFNTRLLVFLVEPA